MHFPSNKREQGSVLVVSLVTCLIIGMTLASYLLLISNRYTLTVRSMDWNAAMPVLEAGIEEALAHLHTDANNPSANGWTADTVGGQPVRTKRRDFADGSYFYVTLYNPTSNNPTIYSSGFVPAPLGKGYITRMVKVTTVKPKVFSAGISANGKVTVSGAAVVDSYNSCLGAYGGGNSLGTNGAIATNYRGTPAIDVKSGQVYGKATTGPGGSVTTSGSGSIGDKDWNGSHQHGVQSGWSGNDMNVAFPTNAPPPGPYLPPLVVSLAGSNITMLASGTYKMASFSSSNKKDPMVVAGNAILYVTGNVDVSANGFITILPGASLTLYVGGNADISGGGAVNGTGLAKNFTYIGLPTSTKLTIGSNADFIGTVNAPQADVFNSGGGTFIGSLIANSYTGTGNGSFHYDECLGAASDLTIDSWREL